MGERRTNKRPTIDRRQFNTSIEAKLIELLQEKSYDTGIPMNRLIEDAIREKYQRDNDK